MQPADPAAVPAGAHYGDTASTVAEQPEKKNSGLPYAILHRDDDYLPDRCVPPGEACGSLAGIKQGTSHHKLYTESSQVKITPQSRNLTVMQGRSLEKEGFDLPMPSEGAPVITQRVRPPSLAKVSKTGNSVCAV